MPQTIDEFMNKLTAMSKLTEDYDAMLKVIEQEEKNQPDEHIIKVLKGWALHHLRRYEEALRSFDDAIVLNPRSGWAFYRKGQMLSEMGRNDDALECFEKAVKLKPRRPEFWIEKGLVEDKLRRVNGSFQSYETAIRLGDRTGWALAGKARILTYLNRYEEALDAARAAMRLDPGETVFRNYEQTILDKLGEF
jgi:tetratricopeptide (TPR) repeat protein